MTDTPAESLRIGCLVANCGRIAYSRGLCPRHWRRMRAELTAGLVTEAAAIARGLLLPSRQQETYRRLGRLAYRGRRRPP